MGRQESKIHKTKHRVKFANDGVSFAFVFRCVKKTSKFDLNTHLWLWRFESNVAQESVKKYMRCLPSRQYIESFEHHLVPMALICSNMCDFLKRNHGYKFIPRNKAFNLENSDEGDVESID